MIWVRSRNCGCLVTWFCYQLIAKPGNKTAAVPWPDPYGFHDIDQFYPLFRPYLFHRHPDLEDLCISYQDLPWCMDLQVLDVTFLLQGHKHDRADSRLACSQWESSLQSNAVSHWLGEKHRISPAWGIYDGFCILLKIQKCRSNLWLSARLLWLHY